MSRYAYTAKVAPLGRRIDVDDGKGEPVVLDKDTFDTWTERPWHVKVRLDHNPLKTIGQLSDLRVRGDWYWAEFLLDPALRNELLVGQPVSIGCTQMRRTGLLLLQAISMVRRGGIAGAEIVSRRELKPAPKPRQPTIARTPRTATRIAHDERPTALDLLYDEEQARWVAQAPPGVIRRPGIGQVIGIVL